jgi:CheY-like chemotaxis protein
MIERIYNSTTHQALQPSTVLIVEDEGVSRRALAKLLTAVGFKVVAAVSGEEAMEKIALAHKVNAVPQIALVDLDLPGINGAGLIQWINERHPDIRAFLMTGAAEDRLRLTLRNCSVPCLRKPLDFGHVMNFMVMMLSSPAATPDGPLAI